MFDSLFNIIVRITRSPVLSQLRERFARFPVLIVHRNACNSSQACKGMKQALESKHMENTKQKLPSTEAAPALSDPAVDSSNSYAAVIENRAKEVGVAVLQLDTLKLQISQFIEAGRCYTTTQLLLDACAPRQVVLVGSQHHEVSAGVNQAVAAGWNHVLLPRSCFDDTKGILAVQELTGWSANSTTGEASTGAEASSSTAGSLLLHKSHYLGFGAAGALLHHLKHDCRLALAPRSVQVEFEGIKHHMSLDRDVIISLELLSPSRSRAALQKALARNSSNLSSRPPAAAAAAVGDRDAEDAFAPSDSRRGRTGGTRQQLQHAGRTSKRSSSLFGFLDYTYTSCGSRLLRTNLLQPLTDINTLQLRLDSLQDLLESPHFSLELMGLMDMLPKNLDTVCSNLAIRPSESASKDTSLHLGRLVSSVILLRDVLRCLPAMADSMAWVDSALLKAIRANFGNEELQQLLAAVEDVLDEDAQASKTQFVNKVQQCFAVRAQADSFLDVSRSTFTRLTEAIHELAAQYRNSTRISALKVQYSSSKGFYLVVPNQHVAGGAAAGPTAGGAAAAAAGGRGPSDAAGTTGGRGGLVPQLPKSFLVLEKRGHSSTCVTTHELNALNSRLRDAAADCIMLTVQVLEQLVSKLLGHMPLLLRLLDNIALLDMLLSFFQAVTGSDGDWCRPVLSPTGPLAITRGRHPLLQAQYGCSATTGRECVPNDTYISSAATLHLVTGPNMSGKSTYLKQVALLVILSQVGCYVPAAFMALSPYDSLHTRIGTADSIESNASSFMVEMADMAHLMDRAGPHSLVIIDELGRATSTSDGVALCWAVSEYLLALGAHTLLATHFRQLDELAAVYPNAKLWQMQVAVTDNDIDFKWTISSQAPQAMLAADTSGGSSTATQMTAAAAASDVTSHYGILLSKMAALPPSITDAALRIAQQLDATQQQRQQRQGGDVSMQRLRQVYSLVHKLGCVAREAVGQGLLPVDVAGQLTAARAGEDGSEGLEGSRGTAASALRVGGGASSSSGKHAQMSACMQMVQQLKQEAEKLLLAVAREPAASSA